MKCLFHGILHLHVSPQMCKQLCLEREYRRRCRCYALFAQEHNDTKNDLGGVDIRCSLFNTTQSESIRPSVTAYQSPSRGCLHIRRFCGLLSMHCRITCLLLCGSSIAIAKYVLVICIICTRYKTKMKREDVRIGFFLKR